MSIGFLMRLVVAFVIVMMPLNFGSKADGRALKGSQSRLLL